MVSTVACASWCRSVMDTLTSTIPPIGSERGEHGPCSFRGTPCSAVAQNRGVRDHLVGFIHREAGASVPHIMVQHDDAMMMIDLSVDDALR